MKIGFDFDNTIIDYSEIFYEIARLNNFIPDNIGRSKSAIKDYLHKKNEKEDFTKIQGLVYGKEILRAKPAKNIIITLDYLKTCNHDLYIVSHKTKYPYIGKQINLREAANKWIYKYIRIEDSLIFKNKNIFYENTIDSKIKRIKNLELDFFIDDLNTIIELIKSPTTGILYDPKFCNKETKYKKINNHIEFKNFLER